MGASHGMAGTCKDLAFPVRWHEPIPPASRELLTNPAQGIDGRSKDKKTTGTWPVAKINQPSFVTPSIRSSISW